MKTPKRSVTAAVILLMVWGGVTVLFSRPKVCEATVQGVKVLVFDTTRIDRVLNVHGPSDRVLKIGAQEFKKVRGIGCSFIEIPQIKSIFFITDLGSKRQFHVYNLETKAQIVIPATIANYFGGTLGSFPPRDDVMLQPNGKLLLIQRGFRGTNWFQIDLQSGELMRLPGDAAPTYTFPKGP